MAVMVAVMVMEKVAQVMVGKVVEMALERRSWCRHSDGRKVCTSVSQAQISRDIASVQLSEPDCSQGEVTCADRGERMPISWGDTALWLVVRQTVAMMLAV